MTSANEEIRRTPLEQLLEFYDAVRRPVRREPTLDLPRAELDLILSLLDEEVAEFKRALEDRDIVGVADGLADVVYVAYGAALQFGIDLDLVLAEVHAANMTKPNADGTVRRARDGKILRGDKYRPPALGPIVAKGVEGPSAGGC